MTPPSPPMRPQPFNNGTPPEEDCHGSMAELIDDGVTGFFVDNFTEVLAAIGRIGEIDRAACRRATVDRFGVDRMADDYLALYRSLLRDRSRPPQPEKPVPSRLPTA